MQKGKGKFEGRKQHAPYVPARCSPSCFKSALGKMGLQQHHYEALEKTPFKHLIHLEEILMHKPLIRALYDKWDPATKSFRLGCISVPFKANDVALALGLPVRGEAINVNRVISTDKRNPPPLVDGWPFRKANVVASVILQEIKAIVGRIEEEYINKTVTYVLLHLFATILFTQSAHQVDQLFWPFVDDLKNIGNSWENRGRVHKQNRDICTFTPICHRPIYSECPSSRSVVLALCG
ncbi:uncharacterized protein LOC143880980 [Tasmannia lanceolata]|uniref:uncharacterized protein LOC143880980 n=1 Tax=Tasmannia lanceolata TaxID=3420 RepID=UPI004063EA51